MTQNDKLKVIEDRFIARLLDDIRHKRIILPTLPELTLKIRNAASSSSTTAAQLAQLVATDPALSARLLQVVNSPMYRGTTTISTIQAAVTRLGQTLVRTLILSMVVSQMYQQGVPASIRQRLALIWAHAIQTAAISHVLAQKFTQLVPEQAMLAGLTHDIGKLPILVQLEQFPDLLENEETVARLLQLLHPQIGKVILEIWKLPPELVAVATEHENLERNPSPQVDYADVVLVANLHDQINTPRFNFAQWPAIPACSKLGLNPEQYLAALSDAQHEILEIQRLLTA